MFYSKEEVLNNFIENNVYEEYKNELSKKFDAEEVVIKLTPEAINAFENTITNNLFSQYIIIKDEEQFPYIFHKFDQALKEHYYLRSMIHLTKYKPTNESSIIIDRKISGREYTVYTFTQIKDNSIVIFYWYFKYIDYKDKVKNL